MSRLLRHSISAVAVAVACILSALVTVSFQGVVPANDLDFGWRYGVAVAEAQHIPFGAGLVFTFGPLSFLYSQMALPEQRSLYLILGATLAVAFCLVVALAARSAWRWIVIALPLVLANQIVPDGFFLVMPLSIVVVATAREIGERLRSVALVAFAGTLGLLPLVKGTMTVPVVVCVGLATAVIAGRRRHLLAGAMISAPALVAMSWWVALGQPLGSMPTYFVRQAWIADGYTNAMSLWGPAWQVGVFLMCAALLLLSALVTGSKGRWSTSAGAACVLFVAFKAGFVRHDGHAMIAGGTLALTASILAIGRASAWSAAALIISIAGWAAIAGAYVPVDPRDDVERLLAMVRQSSDGLSASLTQPSAFASRFDRAKAEIARAVDLPPTDGSVDLYAAEQVAVLASNRIYNPRPILQSYSAYTPELARLNADHLSDDAAPRTIFFEITPSDEHYPSLEDGASWPALLSGYSFRQFAGSFVVLDRSTAPGKAVFDPATTDASFAFDQDVPIPPDPLVWAELNIRPTWAGQIVSTLWKLPKLTIDLTYEDGSQRSYRMIAGTAGAGFLLSPTVTNAYSFVALRDQGAPLTPSSRVRSFRLHQDGRMWGGTFGVRLAEMHLPADRGAEFEAMARPGPDLTALEGGGDCSIDLVGETINRGVPIMSDARYLRVTGWGYASAKAGIPSSRLDIAVRDATGQVRYADSLRSVRPDLNAHFGAAIGIQAGFGATVDLDGLKGPFALSVVQETSSGTRVCLASSVQVIRPAL